MNKTSQHIELLSPAKDVQCGIEAIKHGADAVYIGAPRFSARSAAGNELADIEKLIHFAHLYHARIYIALNTILKDSELDEVEKLIWQLYNIGSDALIIQDMGILEMNLPPIPLHASTQTDNRSLQKIKFLEETGFSQIVLARELSLNDIKQISSQTTAKLEVFVHGALCVSYSGQCYLSEAYYKRSANRGECAQCCRLPYDLFDKNGKAIIAEKHLLSLKDLNRSAYLQQLIEAGVSSFKIEGRLKDISYVKNITAYYRQKLDSILSEKNLPAASSGTCKYTFIPNPYKSFNRGFTDYFLTDQRSDISSFDTPKSIGEYIGTVKHSKGNTLKISGQKKLHNGDGLCYLNPSKGFSGFRINRIESNVISSKDPVHLPIGTQLFRNYDIEFEKLVSKESAERKIAISITISDNAFGFCISVVDEDTNSVSLTFPFEKVKAKQSQKDNVISQFQKFGHTIFQVEKISINWSADWFIPTSVVSIWRKKLIERLYSIRKINYRKPLRKPINRVLYPIESLTYLGNVYNKKATAFYVKSGVKNIDPAFEFKQPENAVLMFTKHCIKYDLGLCPKTFGRKNNDSIHPKYSEPFFLITKNNQLRLKLEFDCSICEMKIKKAE